MGDKMSYDDDGELNEIKREIDQRMWRRGLLGGHLVLWLVGSAIVGIRGPWLVELVAPAWFGLVMLHGLLVLLWENRDKAIKAEVERREALRGSEKLKRDRLYRLADDGELIEVDEDEDIRVKAAQR
jgi:hypothetical protein